MITDFTSKQLVHTIDGAADIAVERDLVYTTEQAANWLVKSRSCFSGGCTDATGPRPVRWRPPVVLDAFLIYWAIVPVGLGFALAIIDP